MTIKTVILAGAAPDTGNLGVNALCHSAVAGLLEHDPSIDLTVLSHGKSLIIGGYKVASEKYCNVMGAKLSRRWFEPSSFKNIETIKHIPIIKTKQKSVFSKAKAILDISGGDSYTDLYGDRRFKAISYPKKLAISYGKPLVLLPQTYGPFSDSALKSAAQKYLRYASFAFARDQHSFNYMQELLGDRFDPEIHKQTLDVAFLLTFSSDEVLLEKGLSVPEIKPGSEVFGVNVSGLIYCNAEAANSQYKISINYKRLLLRAVETILNEEDGDVWLIPHVLAHPGHYESDTEACRDLKSLLQPNHQSRVKLVAGDFDQCDIKSVIRRCSWFCGTRMHATIAALSSGVPTIGLAYSGKFQGVFESVGQGHSVADARTELEQDILDKILDSCRNRNNERRVLEKTIPEVVSSAKDQMRMIAKAVSRWN